MSYRKIKDGSSYNVPIDTYYCDYETDIQNLNVDEESKNAEWGSKVYCLENSTWYVKNSDGEWVRVKKTLGTTFIPEVDKDGNISWSNDGDLPDPVTQNIKGPQGKSAYEYAQQYGFMGTEEEFGRLMSLISDVDQIGNIEDYWQYNEQTEDLVTAINQNADYVNRNFEKNENKSQIIQLDDKSEIKYPSVKAVYDLGQDIMNLVNQRFAPHIIYDDPTGFEASNDDAGDTWHLTGLNLSQYKRIKCYVCSGGDGDANYSPEHIVEVYLDDRAKGSFGYFTASHAGHCPNNRNRHHIATFTVNAEKTAIQFQHSISMYGTAASDSVGDRRCYLIEGYVL